jgi:Lon protease-like protein
MMSGPERARLPEILPIFPLTGVLLLPGTLLPLHVFEPRYRNLVADALAAARVFGMIQPVAPRQDNRPLPGAELQCPELYRVGCAGFMEQAQRLPDGRYLVTLRGISRFRAIEELPLHRGYRRVRADYGGFQDLAPQPARRGGRTALLEALAGYCRTHGLALDRERADALADGELVNAIAVALPFHPSEKQALLEAASLGERERVLLDLLRMGGESSKTADSAIAPLN